MGDPERLNHRAPILICSDRVGRAVVLALGLLGKKVAQVPLVEEPVGWTLGPWGFDRSWPMTPWPPVPGSGADGSPADLWWLPVPRGASDGALWTALRIRLLEMTSSSGVTGLLSLSVSRRQLRSAETLGLSPIPCKLSSLLRVTQRDSPGNLVRLSALSDAAGDYLAAASTLIHDLKNGVLLSPLDEVLANNRPLANALFTRIGSGLRLLGETEVADLCDDTSRSISDARRHASLSHDLIRRWEDVNEVAANKRSLVTQRFGLLA